MSKSFSATLRAPTSVHRAQESRVSSKIWTDQHQARHPRSPTWSMTFDFETRTDASSATAVATLTCRPERALQRGPTLEFGAQPQPSVRA